MTINSVVSSLCYIAELIFLLTFMFLRLDMARR
jgi:hypothetical protein